MVVVKIVKSFNFVGTKFSGLMTMNMFVDTCNAIFINYAQNSYIELIYCGILYSSIAVSTKYTKIYVQQTKISQYYSKEQNL